MDTRASVTRERREKRQVLQMASVNRTVAAVNAAYAAGELHPVRVTGSAAGQVRPLRKVAPHK